MYAQQRDQKDVLPGLISRLWHYGMFSTMNMCYFVIKKNAAVDWMFVSPQNSYAEA